MRERLNKIFLDNFGTLRLPWILLILTGGAMTLIVGSVSFFGPIACDAIAETYGLPNHWGFWEGCFLEVDGQWIATDNYRAVVQVNP